ncbi:hypothetical protein DYH09_19585 [bacterium CPR1]|nr:hypothetical protein [bacterium CPR1]
MQVPSLGSPLTPWTAPARAASAPENASPDQVILGGNLNVSPAPRTGIEAAVAWALCPAPLGGELAALATDLKARGFILSDGKNVVSPEGLDGWPVGGLQVSQESSEPKSPFAVLPAMNVERIPVSSFQELKDLSHSAREEFSAMTDPRAAAPFARLEKEGGVKLLVAESNYRVRESDKGLMHAKVMVIDTADPESLKNVWPLDDGRFKPIPEHPRPAGVYGAHREAARGTLTNVWVQGPQATRPCQLTSLEAACFFYLGEPHPELDRDPLACQMRELARSGVQLLPSDATFGLVRTVAHSEDAMAVHASLRSNPEAVFHVALDGVAWTPAPLGPDGLLQLGPDFEQARQYRSEHLLSLPVAERKTTLDVLAVPSGQSVEAKLALYERLKAFHKEHPSENAMTHLKLFGMGEPEETEALADMRRLAAIASPTCPLEALVDPFLELRAGQGLRPEWLAPALAYFHEHGSEARERLLELGRLGGSFQDSLEADRLLTGCGVPYPEALKAYQAVASAVRSQDHKAMMSGTSMAGRWGKRWEEQHKWVPMPQRPTQVFARLLELRAPEQDLTRVGEALGALIKRLDDKTALELFPRLLAHPGDPATVTDRFLREERLAGDTETALKCLQPGSCPEPLELREKAEQLLWRPEHESVKGINLNAFFDRQQGTVNFGTGVDSSLDDYRFLVGLSDRKLLEDAQTLADLNRKLSSKDARALLTELKSGQLGKIQGSELVERLQVELDLQGDPELALESLRQPPEPFEQRRLLAARLHAALGEGPVAPDYQLLTGESLPGSSLDERLEALSRLRQALEPSEGVEASRQAYQTLVGSVRDGAWTGRELGQATESFLKSYLACSSLSDALKALARGPVDEGQVAGGVQVNKAGVTVGGVRVRTRSPGA